MSDFPYPGLRPFKRDETDIFFGRDELSNQLIERLGDTPFLAVVGVPGCGKSSLVRTGLLACLERGFLPKAGIRWRIAELRPGNCPFTRLTKALLVNTTFKKEYTAHFVDNTKAPKHLEASLRRGPLSLHEILQVSPLPPNTNLLLIVDQFEELFRHYQQGEENETATFVNLLLDSSKHPFVYVVITMRSDFMSDCATFSGLPEAINQGLFFTPRLTRKQLRDAIERPAVVFGSQVEPELTNCLLNEMSNDPEQLPVLQHVLMRMWDRVRPKGLEAIDKELEEMAKRPSQERILTLKHYQEIGEFKNALSQHADEVYAKLTKLVVPPNAPKIAEILFRRLCERDEVHRYTRSPVSLDEVAKLANIQSWKQVADVIDVFRKDDRHFLTPSIDVDLTPDSVIDISHESLIQHWERLRDWANEEAESAKTYRRLEDRACLWKEKRAELLSGVELEIALDWHKNEQPTAIWAKRYGLHFDLTMRFLEESETEQKRKQEEEKTAQKNKWQHECDLKQTRKQRTWAFIGLVSAIVVLVMVAGIALWGFRERTNALNAKLETQINNVAWLGRFDNYKAAKKELEKIKESGIKMPASRSSAYHLLAWFNKLLGGTSLQTYQAGAPLFTVAVSSDGKRLVAAGENGTLILWNTESGQLWQRLEEHTQTVQAVVFDPKGNWFASAGDDKQIIFWSLSTGEQIQNWQVAHSVRALAVSPDGKYLASGGTNNNIILWDVKTGQTLHTFKEHKGVISSLDFSSNGELLASASYDDTVRVWNVETRQALHTLLGHTDNVYTVTFSPDDHWLATSSKDTTIRLWNMDSGQSERLLLGHKQAVFSVRFIGDDGRALVSASDDLTLRVWHWDWESPYDVTTRVLQGHTAGVNSVAVYEQKLFSASEDGTVKRWDITLPYQQLDLPGKPLSTAIAPDGNSVAVGFADGVLRLYALPKANLLWEKPTAHNKDIRRIAFSADGTLLASASFDSTAKLWQVKEGGLQQTLSGHQDKINAIAFSPNDQTIATASFDGQIGLFTVGTEQKRFYQAHDGKVKAVSFDASGTQLLSTSDDEIRLWTLKNDLPTLQQEYPSVSDKWMWATLSPNGQQMASVGRNQVVHLYSTTGKSTQYDLTGHESTIYRVIFTPNGQQIATVSADATLRLWDLHEQEGKELFRLRLPTNKRWPVPFRDFDFRCVKQEQHNCWIAVPLTRGKLMLYELGNIYEDTNP
jgi:WD40 repeat protein